MPCFHPLPAWQAASGDVFFYPKGTEGKSRLAKGPDFVRELDLPCGQCVGCRLERSRIWAMRCMHEAQMHEENSFLTLTYSEDHLPYQGQLVYRHFQLFMKRLRYEVGKPLRFYMCGEYGEQLDRPHYHCVLFGHAFYDDRVPYKSLAQGGYLYRSDFLDSVWSRGITSIGEVTFESAAYVARYCMKKVNGAAQDEHYSRVDGITGEIYQKEPEFSKMSLKPGIGGKWLDAFESDVINHGNVLVNGMTVRAPRYYEKVLEERDGLQKDLLELTRFEKMRAIDPRDRTYERMRVREEVLKAKVSLKRRNFVE